MQRHPAQLADDNFVRRRFEQPAKPASSLSPSAPLPHHIWWAHKSLPESLFIACRHVTAAYHSAARDGPCAASILTLVTRASWRMDHIPVAATVRHHTGDYRRKGAGTGYAYPVPYQLRTGIDQARAA